LAELQEHREAIEIFRLSLELMIRTFKTLLGAAETHAQDPMHSGRCSQSSSAKIRETGPNGQSGNSTEYRLMWTPERQEELDFQELKNLKTRASNMLEMIQQRADSFRQSVIVGEAQVANNQARSVKALTALAAFALPFGVIAAIFTIPGAVSPGSIHFWIYWAVAIPFAFLIVLLLLSPVGRGIWKIQRRFWRMAFAPIRKCFQGDTATSLKERVLRWVPEGLRYDEERLYELEREREDM